MVASKYKGHTLSDVDIQSIIQYADFDWFSSYKKIKDLSNEHNLDKQEIEKIFKAWGFFPSNPLFIIFPLSIDDFFLKSFELRLLRNIITAGMITSKFLYEDKVKTIKEIFEEMKKEMFHSFKGTTNIIVCNDEFSFLNS